MRRACALVLLLLTPLCSTVGLKLQGIFVVRMRLAMLSRVKVTASQVMNRVLV